MSKTEANGIGIHYDIRGEGDPILIIGGLADDLTRLQELFGRLGKKHQVIAFDNRGVGRFDKPDMPYSIEMMAENVAGLLSTIGISQVDVLGVSLGWTHCNDVGTPPSKHG